MLELQVAIIVLLALIIGMLTMLYVRDRRS
jgi:hypothetical protein